MAFRVLQISDTHVSATHTHFAANLSALRAHLAEVEADLLVATGDICMDGAGPTEDLALAAAWFAGLDRPWRAVPGNHDVGDIAEIRPDQVIDDARLAAWEAGFGECPWHVDVEGWRLIGLDAMLFGSGHPAEEPQWARLAELAATERRIALFLHKPLFLERVDEGPRGYWTVRPAPRARLFAALGDADLGLVASGHLHVSRIREIDGTAHVWGPAASFVCGPMQEDVGGDRWIGTIEHVFDGDRVESRFVRPEGAADLILDPVHDEIYPPHAKPETVR